MESQKLSAEQINNKALGKTKTKDKRNEKMLLLSIGGTFSLILVVTLISFLLGAFDVKNVNLSHPTGLKYEYLNTDSLEVEVLQLLSEESLPFVKILETRDKVKEMSPFVKDVYIEKQFPDSINIVTTERKPFLSIQTQYLCTVLDPEGFVLEYYTKDDIGDDYVKAEDTDFETLDCEDLFESYNGHRLYSNEVKAEFEVSQKSTFFDIEKLLLMTRSAEAQNYTVEKIVLKDRSYTLFLEGDRELYYSADQDISLQVKRFVLVIEQTEIDDLDFESLDLRYDRPVMIEKEG